MDVFVILFAIVAVFFGVVLLRGAPYLPTLSKQIDDAFDLLDLRPGQTLLELGSGDGRVLAAAARRGIKAVGYELNPLLVIYTRLRYWRYRQLIHVRLADFWRVQWPATDGVFVFLLDPYMKKLDTKIAQTLSDQEQEGTVRVVSFSFKIPGKKPVKTKNGLYLYEYRSRK